MSVKSSSTLIIFVIIFGRIVFMREKSKEDDVVLSIKESGYQGELHHAITEDGYILGLQRIKSGPNDITEMVELNSRPPVLILHGLESSAMDWVYFHGNQSLPYLLYEKGYDVWLGNVRGTPSSYNHTTLDPRKDRKFWDTSIEEIGIYDLPAMIDHVLKNSNYEKLFYIGMSQGEATFLILTSTKPEYNEKFELACLTSPSSHLKHSDNVVMKTLGKHWNILQTLAWSIDLSTIPGRSFLGKVCRYHILSSTCRFLSHPFIGYADLEQFTLETTTKYFRVTTHSALKQLVHYLQIYNTGIFRKFDYGRKENLIKYGEEMPPEYDLSRISVPVAYFWGENDCWSRPKDVYDIERKLPNMVLSYKVTDKFFNHYDVMTAKNAKTLAYDHIISLIQKFTK